LRASNADPCYNTGDEKEVKNRKKELNMKTANSTYDKIYYYSTRNIYKRVRELFVPDQVGIIKETLKGNETAVKYFNNNSIVDMEVKFAVYSDDFTFTYEITLRSKDNNILVITE